MARSRSTIRYLEWKARARAMATSRWDSSKSYRRSSNSVPNLLSLSRMITSEPAPNGVILRSCRLPQSRRSPADLESNGDEHRLWGSQKPDGATGACRRALVGAGWLRERARGDVPCGRRSAGAVLIVGLLELLVPAFDNCHRAERRRHIATRYRDVGTPFTERVPLASNGHVLKRRGLAGVDIG